MPDIKIIQYGLGSIGCSIVRHILGFPEYKLVGAVDIDPQKIGKDVGEVVGLKKKLNLVVSADLSAVGRANADLVLHSTTSRLNSIRSQLVEAIEAGSSVISTSEELVYPYATNYEIAEEIDRLAKKNGVAVLGVGVNPGFVMDTLPLMLTSVCKDVRKIKVTRILDASQRRLPLQRKIGAGFSVDEFNDRVAAGTLGHVGLVESARMISDTLGWKLESIEVNTEPVVAKKRVETQFLEVDQGKVAGIKQVVSARAAEEEVLSLELQMYVGAEDPHDSVFIDGTPPIDLVIRGGIHGDSATVAIVVNSIPRVLASGPGLVTTSELPILFHRSRSV